MEDKHLQLGADLSNDDRTEMTDQEKDDAWADSTTVEQFEEDLATLATEPPEVQTALAAAREEGG